MKRNIDKYLVEWREAPERRVLLVRGARQVGKTFSIRQLGSTFQYFVEVNFDFDPKVKKFFEGTHDPITLCEKLTAYYDIPIIPGATLLFLDEIQACPEALPSLRYFFERMPQLHVVATGSLLEFALEQLPSFGVGRISSLFLYPMSFYEFTMSLCGDALANMLQIKNCAHIIDPVFHSKFLDLFRTYCMVGGMPAVVKHYKEKRDLRSCQKLLDELLSTFKDDFAKYKTRIPQERLSEALSAVAYQATTKFNYSRMSDTATHASSKQAIDLLEMAGLIHKVYHSSAGGIPLGAQINPKRFKTLPMDLGLHQRLLGLDLQEILTDDAHLINKGSLAEVFVGLELCSSSAPESKRQLYYWHREGRSSNAEVDYIIQKGTDVIPIEVKSSRRGSMQSLALFMAEHNSPYGLRLSLENCSN